MLAARRGDGAAAAADWRRILALDPIDTHAAYNLAIYEARSGRQSVAATLLESVLRRLPADAPDAARLRALLTKLG